MLMKSRVVGLISVSWMGCKSIPERMSGPQAMKEDSRPCPEGRNAWVPSSPTQTVGQGGPLASADPPISSGRAPRGFLTRRLSLVDWHSSLILEPFQHPHVAVGGGAQYGEVAAVGRRHTPDRTARSPLLLPQHPGIPHQIHIE